MTGADDIKGSWGQDRGPPASRRTQNPARGDISSYLWKEALQVSSDPGGHDLPHLLPLDPRQIPTRAGYQDSQQAKMGHCKQRCHVGMSRTSNSNQQALLLGLAAPGAEGPTTYPKALRVTAAQPYSLMQGRGLARYHTSSALALGHRQASIQMARMVMHLLGP